MRLRLLPRALPRSAIQRIPISLTQVLLSAAVDQTTTVTQSRAVVDVILLETGSVRMIGAVELEEGRRLRREVEARETGDLTRLMLRRWKAQSTRTR